MKSARVSRNVGDLHASNTVSASRRLPTAGKIRPGVKVLTQAAAKVAGAIECYNKGVADGLSFDTIFAELKKIKGMPNWPLTPKNAPYFTVRQCDFTTDGAAKAIMDRYATVRPGDPEPRLYSFPVIFPSDSLDLIFREQFEAWKASELVRWSEIDPESGELMCLRRSSTAPDPQSRRRWGGRPTEAERACNPNDCALFGNGDCKHVGSLAFWVPGVPGVGTIELTFTSVYASMGVAETLDMVRMGLGRVSGLLPNGSPIFWISKRRDRVARMNWETGKTEKTEQWIIQLEASGLDMSQVLHAPALAAPERVEPAPALEAPKPEPVVEPEPVAAHVAHHEAPDPAVAELRKQLSALVSTLGWDPDDLRDWVSTNYGGPEAARNPESLEAMVRTLTGLAEAMASQPEPAHEPALAGDIDDEEAPF